MPIRIYALAKELEMDSKELVEVCTKAGIPGKGSALASLNDDEVEKVKTFLRGPSPSGGASTSAGPSGRSGSGLRVGRSGGGLRGRGSGSATTGAGATPETPITREDYIGPTGYGGKIRVIDTRSRKQKPTESEPTQPVEEAAPPPPEETPAAEPPAPAVQRACRRGSCPSSSQRAAGRRWPRPESDLLRPREPGSIKVIGAPKVAQEARSRTQAQTPCPGDQCLSGPHARGRVSRPRRPRPPSPRRRSRRSACPKRRMTVRKGQRRPPLEHLTEKKSKKDTKRHAPAKASEGDENLSTTAKRGRRESENGWSRGGIGRHGQRSS